MLYFFLRKLKAAQKNGLPNKDAQWQAQHKTIFYLPLLRLYVFHRFGQYFYAISRARVVIRSGSSITARVKPTNFHICNDINNDK